MKIAQINRILWLFFGIGILVIIVGFLNGPLLPYTDPTPELIKIYNTQVKKSDFIMKCGCIIAIISLFSILIKRIIRKMTK
ncbi:hypothetical protein HQN89_23655 [Paenibacillus frigoriresistens]|uniref:hypothetical protein n=1 Tax=Paenibacillus alginolyticus TaxID=59839 RepID=UPI001564CC71|nr:hypothetical protein [Paenibacillus frigoriresistens]NRF93927.1 hypothetical protein [Paenibacillus frigoriresistens]